MRLLSRALFCLAICSSIPLLRAEPIDPQISIGDPGSGTLLNSDTWTFSSDANGGGTFDFTNDTRQLWASLDFIVTLPTGDTITCSSTIYSACSFTESGSPSAATAVYDVGFENAVTSPGIVPGESFTVNLNDVPSVDHGGWGADTSIEGIANLDVPEPASWLLAAAGLLVGVLVIRQRRAA